MYIDAIGLLVKQTRNLIADGIVLIGKQLKGPLEKHNPILMPEEDQKKISHVKLILLCNA